MGTVLKKVTEEGVPAKSVKSKKEKSIDYDYESAVDRKSRGSKGQALPAKKSG